MSDDLIIPGIANFRDMAYTLISRQGYKVSFTAYNDEVTGVSDVSCVDDNYYQPCENFPIVGKELHYGGNAYWILNIAAQNKFHIVKHGPYREPVRLISSQPRISPPMPTRPEITLIPAAQIFSPYAWEITFTDSNNIEHRDRVNTPNYLDAITYARQNRIMAKIPFGPEVKIRAELVDPYLDDGFEPRKCDHCSREYRGPAVFCSFACACAGA